MDPQPCPRCNGSGIVPAGDGLYVACGCPAGERAYEQMMADEHREWTSSTTEAIG